MNNNNNITDFTGNGQDISYLSRKKSIQELIEDFRAKALANGISLPEYLELDDRIHRYPDKARGDHNPNGFYRININCQVPWGLYGNWSTKHYGCISNTWIDSGIDTLTQEDRQRMLKIVEASKKESLRELIQEREQAEENANYIWNRALRLDKDMNHQYLINKQISPCGAKLYFEDNTKLIIPIYNHRKKIISLQFIDQIGQKRFLKGTSPKQGYYMLNEYSKSAICICEGYATGVSIHLATNYRVAIAFSADNLVNVAHIIKRLYKNITIIICADNDAYGEQNIGLLKAKEAANEIDAIVVYPTFKDISKAPTDFNDLYVLEGKEAVVNHLAKISIIRNETLQEFMNRKFVEGENIIDPWLQNGTLNMLYSKPGIGKSLLALYIAYSIAAGKSVPALEWNIKKARKVLYFDGELKSFSLQKNLQCISNNNIDYFISENLIISTLNDSIGGEIDLANNIWQSRIDDIINLRNPNLIIIDNILCFVKSGKTNEVDFWNRITTWTKKHIAVGISFLFVHHENKHGNTSFGTSAIENSMSSVISLYRPSNYKDDDEIIEPKDGATTINKEKEELETIFVLDYTKCRYFGIKKLNTLEVKIKSNFIKYTFETIADIYKQSIKQKIIDLYNSCLISQKEIQNELSDNGRLKPPSRQYISKVLHWAQDHCLLNRSLK